MDEWELDYSSSTDLFVTPVSFSDVLGIYGKRFENFLYRCLRKGLNNLKKKNNARKILQFLPFWLCRPNYCFLDFYQSFLSRLKSSRPIQYP